MKEGYSLRPYQQSAVDFVSAAFGNNNIQEGINQNETAVSSAIVVRPTGTGKTIIIASIVENELNSGGRVLILAHRNKLLEQAHDKILSACGIDASYEGKPGGDERVVICSIQSMSRDDRLAKYPADYFSLIVVDETHHIASPSYIKVREHFSTAKLVGVTATPVRGDGHDTREDFDVVGPEYTTEQAIEDGFLTPVSVAKIPLEIDISRVHMQGGDYSASDVGAVLERYLVRIAKKTAELTKGKKTIIFTPLVSTAQKLANIFNNETDLRADYVAGERKDSDVVLERYNNNEIDVIINAMLLTEGFDCPAIDCIINLRPTRSKSLYVQMIGRALRLYPGKDHATVLDFLWQDNGRGRLSAQDALLDNDDPFIRNAMEEELESGEEIDLQELRARAENKAIEAREAALADALEKANALAESMSKEQKELLNALTEYAINKARNENVSPLNIYGVIRRSPKVAAKYHCMSASLVAVRVDDPVLEDMCLSYYEAKLGSEWEQERPTMKQLSLLEKFGIPVGYAVSKGHASFLIDGFINRNEEGLASYKQVKALRRFGYVDAHNLSKKECKQLLELRIGKKKKKS